tara:strand:- start:141 stop:665 length:525 start_codon:yes stop_codon:yes gene_type:complete
MFDITALANTTPFLFLLSATILTNFIGDTMGCKIQKIFSKNILLKYIVILFLIYTTITLIDKNTTPKEHLLKSIYILILFILFTKNTLRMTVVIGFCMVILFILEDYINHYKNIKNIEGANKLNKLNKISQSLKYIILVLIVVGHILYIVKQKKWFGDKFDIFRLYKSERCSIV